MGRLIDADKLKEHYAWWENGTAEMTLAEAKRNFDTIIDVQPTVEQPQINATENMVEIVRCKDCRHAGVCHKSVQYAHNEPNTVTIGYSPIEWCSMGKRREDAETD